jgi:hypothetical protein
MPSIVTPPPVPLPLEDPPAEELVVPAPHAAAPKISANDMPLTAAILRTPCFIAASIGSLLRTSATPQVT